MAPDRAASAGRGVEAAPGVVLKDHPGGALTLSGPGVDATFRGRLLAWLRDQSSVRA
jgi:hypothetical protein